ncbi:helix-turn-helix domain-containing protein [Rubrobacter radiotolerans]|uniref:helix-turn-helix domain-containing protein n=1 Tax=Rubrobacter radiotolerans TaxID=42256 RepID=UPI000A06EF58
MWRRSSPSPSRTRRLSSSGSSSGRSSKTTAGHRTKKSPPLQRGPFSGHLRRKVTPRALRLQPFSGTFSFLAIESCSVPGDEGAVSASQARSFAGVRRTGISRALCISERTVQDHLKSVFAKVGVRSRRELLRGLFFEQALPGEPGSSGPDLPNGTQARRASRS